MKKSMINSSFLVIYFLCVWINITKTSDHRTKRFLTFPRTSPTRLQFIIGIGVPLDLEIESVTIGWVNKVEYFLPENASNYLNYLSDPFDLTTRLIYGFYVKKREVVVDDPTEKPNYASNEWNRGYDEEQNEKYERHQVQADVIESGKSNEEMTEADYWNQEDNAEWYRKMHPSRPKNLSKSRWAIYKSMEALAESRGLPGRICVLRSICESAHTSFDYSNGILGELAHILMTPTLTKDEIDNHSDYEYYHAEKLGNDGAPCEHIFKECKQSILEQFSGVYTPMFDLFK